jgi:CheY-like chemotaxis protein
MIINAGMHCDVAGNGKEALARIEPATYNIVLMNLVMPEMDGTTATRVLRDKEVKEGLRRLPVIGVSATSDNEVGTDDSFSPRH